MGERFVLLRKLAQGATGTVFEADDRLEKTPCALKIVSNAQAPAGRRQLASEFARLTTLSHPNLVRIRSAGSLGPGTTSDAYLAMDLVSGVPLNDFLERLGEGERLAAFARLAAALVDVVAYLHGRGILHRDINPRNVRCDGEGNPILFDLGLARSLESPAFPGTANGTLGFIAPEALLGEDSPKSDLFSLGATLYQGWTGVPPFGVGRESLGRIWQVAPVPPSAIRDGLPPAWEALLLGMLAVSPERRPANARQLLLALQALPPLDQADPAIMLQVPYPKGDPLEGRFIGRSKELGLLGQVLDRLVEGACPHQVVVVRGIPGMGRGSLIDRALRDLRLGCLADGREVQIEERDLATLMSEQEGAVPPGSRTTEALRLRREAVQAKVIAWLEARAGQSPLCVVLRGGEEERALVELVLRGDRVRRLLFLLRSDGALDGEGVLDLPLAPWSAAEIAQLIVQAEGVSPPADLLQAIHSHSGGIPAAVAILAREWIQNHRHGLPHRLSPMPGQGDVDGLLDASFQRLAPEGRETLTRCLLGVWEGEGADPAEGQDQGWSELRAQGWLRSPGPVLASDRHVAALWRGIGADPTLQRLVRGAVGALLPGDPRYAEARLVLGDVDSAAHGFWLAMEREEAGARLAFAADYGRRALALSPSQATFERRFALSRILALLGRYDDGLALLADPVTEVDRTNQVALVERRAWLCARKGDAPSAESQLRAALASLPLGEADRSFLLARLARTLLSAGRFREAFTLLQDQPLLTARSPHLENLGETLVLTQLYAGDYALADRQLEQLESPAVASLHPGLVGKVAGLRALFHQFQGELEQADACYQVAVRSYEAHGDVHGAAIAHFNLGCVCAERGRFTTALDSFDRAMRELARLGKGPDLAMTVFNAGQLFLELADVPAASRCAQKLRQEAERLGLATLGAQAHLLEAGVLRARREGAAALRLFDQAIAELEGVGLRTAVQSTAFDRLELQLERGELGWVARQLAELEQAHRDQGGAGEEHFFAERLALVQAGRFLRGETAVPPETLGDTLLRLGEQAYRAGRRPMARRLLSGSALVFRRLGDPRAARAEKQTRHLEEELKVDTPSRYWSVYDHAGEPDRSPPGTAADASLVNQWVEKSTKLEQRLKKVVRINKRLNSDLRLSRILETIIDTVIEITDAERGFLLLNDAGGNLVVRVARNIDQTTLDGPDFTLSRSIAKKVADEGQSVFAIDAEGDSRFAEALSVSDLHLRSILAVPLLVKGKAVGAIYVDHRLKKGAFKEDDLSMLEDFAEQGAIAIENARIMSELRRREQQVQALNRRLELDLQRKETALRAVQSELRVSQEAAVLRYNYSNIVGRSPAMNDLFHLIDRMTDTALPVVIEGESGTGKELVARALHFNGPRKNKPFVSENCAAIPEPLLESILFGHQRGSFTGADRESKGLFSIADGGTLFLDEVGEMSAGMQGKLLRVLQEGEFYRVGGERSHKVDVRVIAATNRDLEGMVAQGTFRKDLFYRLCVLRLRLPPLRERQEDIPLLVEHFLGRTSSSRPLTIHPSAMAKLCAYAWPGNVRELENEIMRASTFATEQITVADLSPLVRAVGDEAESPITEADSLSLKSRVERLEKQLLREALRRTQGNQTQTARLLGLSRFGLQKKMARYGISQ